MSAASCWACCLPHSSVSAKADLEGYELIVRYRELGLNSIPSPMFERYTEKARRVIFFARFEASQYGSPYIESEHLLLGLLRTDLGLLKTFLGSHDIEMEIRAEIEKHIERRERISTAIEVPLSLQSREVLKLAAESAARLAHRHIDTQHLFMGLLRVENSLAAQILMARGLKPDSVLQKIAKSPAALPYSEAVPGALLTLTSFLAGLKWLNSQELITFFAKYAQVIDASGKLWLYEEIQKEFETIFAPYAKKNATHVVEATLVTNTPDIFVASILWKNALLASEQRAWTHRMSVVILANANDWEIILIHASPVLAS
jgi:hypothetical protein